ncbi:MAG TPA: hypothetical protein VMM93_07535 [Vicinamibacterales bacterium]|nr:hypothetical protein [Vicinamibacterales bacterium]
MRQRVLAVWVMLALLVWVGLHAPALARTDRRAEIVQRVEAHGAEFGDLSRRISPVMSRWPLPPGIAIGRVSA